MLNELDYYNGIVFQGYVQGAPRAVLSGGRYDLLMRRFGKQADGIGFAVYLDELNRVLSDRRALDADILVLYRDGDDLALLHRAVFDLAAQGMRVMTRKGERPDDLKVGRTLRFEQRNAEGGAMSMFTIALPKGRLGDQVCELFSPASTTAAACRRTTAAWCCCDESGRVRYLLVKPSDVAIYVERGAADVGVCGKDTLLEGGNDVYELMDLGFGKCRMCVAAPVDFREDLAAPLRVATKYPNIAKAYYAAKSREIDIIKLNGSIELAPILGLSDVIVDLVETGTTLKQNHLEILETVLPVSARLIANKAVHEVQGRGDPAPDGRAEAQKEKRYDPDRTLYRPARGTAVQPRVRAHAGRDRRPCRRILDDVKAARRRSGAVLHREVRRRETLRP